MSERKSSFKGPSTPTQIYILSLTQVVVCALTKLLQLLTTALRDTLFDHVLCMFTLDTNSYAQINRIPIKSASQLDLINHQPVQLVATSVLESSSESEQGVSDPKSLKEELSSANYTRRLTTAHR